MTRNCIAAVVSLFALMCCHCAYGQIDALNLLSVLSDQNGGEGAASSSGQSSLTTSNLEVYYLFAQASESWHVLLAENTKVTSGRYMGNNVYKTIRKQVGPDTKLVNVAVNNGFEILDILSRGLLPNLNDEQLRKMPATDGNPKLPCYKYAELERASACRIKGMGIISHSGCDGPILDGPQMTVDFYRRDASRGGKPVAFSESHGVSQTAFKLYTGQVPYVDWKAPPGPTFSERLVNGAHISLFGCNSGNCQGFSEAPSGAHYLAALYAKKNVVVIGKKSYGDPNGRASAFHTYCPNHNGRAARTCADFLISFSDPSRPVSKRGQKHYKSADEMFKVHKWLADKCYIMVKDTVTKRKIDSYGTEVAIEGFIDYEVPNYKRVRLGRGKKPADSAPMIAAFIEVSDRVDWKSALEKKTGKRIRENSQLYSYLSNVHMDQKYQSLVAESKAANGGKVNVNDFKLWHQFSKHGHSRVWKKPCMCNIEKLYQEETLGVQVSSAPKEKDNPTPWSEGNGSSLQDNLIDLVNSFGLDSQVPNVDDQSGFLP